MEWFISSVFGKFWFLSTIYGIQTSCGEWLYTDLMRDVYYFPTIKCTATKIKKIEPHHIWKVISTVLINDTHKGKLVLYRIQYKNSLKNKVGCFWHFSYVYTINQVLLIPLSYRCLKNVIHQIDSKNEWLLPSVTFTAKFDLVFVLKILTGKKHPKIKLQRYGHTNMDIWVVGTSYYSF